ncbi:hypothetical protein PR048_021263 [Dryococelus australis]|uniref:Uncharacterized protein n=1 Tax=Dryococelus australis TaxID=614101 RepID=A0ABQ9GXV9_9NEOP|nr:hypothetical protein PR048_021263 [Dryococelus australis]
MVKASYPMKTRLWRNVRARRCMICQLKVSFSFSTARLASLQFVTNDDGGGDKESTFSHPEWFSYRCRHSRIQLSVQPCHLLHTMFHCAWNLEVLTDQKTLTDLTPQDIKLLRIAFVYDNILVMRDPLHDTELRQPASPSVQDLEAMKRTGDTDMRIGCLIASTFRASRQPRKHPVFAMQKSWKGTLMVRDWLAGWRHVVKVTYKGWKSSHRFPPSGREAWSSSNTTPSQRSVGTEPSLDRPSHIMSATATEDPRRLSASIAEECPGVRTLAGLRKRLKKQRMGYAAHLSPSGAGERGVWTKVDDVTRPRCSLEVRVGRDRCCDGLARRGTDAAPLDRPLLFTSCRPNILINPLENDLCRKSSKYIALMHHSP